MTSDRRRRGRVHPVFCLCEQADPAVVLNDNSSVLVTSHRLQDGSVPPLEQGMVVGQLLLADALIVGNCNNQVLTRSDPLGPEPHWDWVPLAAFCWSPAGV